MGGFFGAVFYFLPFPYIGLYQGHSRPAVSGRAGPGFLPGVALWRPPVGLLGGLDEADDERPGGVERRGRDAVGCPVVAVGGQSVDAVRPAVGQFNR